MKKIKLEKYPLEDHIFTLADVHIREDLKELDWNIKKFDFGKTGSNVTYKLSTTRLNALIPDKILATQSVVRYLEVSLYYLII